jgi:hypothetical protein
MPRGIPNVPKQVSPRDLPVVHQDTAPIEPGVHRFRCVCPHDGYDFIFEATGGVPSPQTLVKCADCKTDYTLERLTRPAAETVKFFGDPVTCRTCGTVYKPKQSGAGAFDPATGRGGDWRACPTCGAHPPGMPTYSSLEDPNVRQQAIP